MRLKIRQFFELLSHKKAKFSRAFARYRGRVKITGVHLWLRIQWLLMEIYYFLRAFGAFALILFGFDQYLIDHVDIDNQAEMKDRVRIRNDFVKRLKKLEDDKYKEWKKNQTEK